MLFLDGARRRGSPVRRLAESIKRPTKEEFHAAIMNARPDKEMPSCASGQDSHRQLGRLHAYLKGRSDGCLQPDRLSALDEK